MNEIVNIHNDFVDLPLKNFNGSEIDILMAICHKCQNKQCNEVVLSFNDIKKLSKYKNKNLKQFTKSIEKTNRKLMALNFKIGTSNNFIQFVLFPLFQVNVDEEFLKVKINEPFAYVLNDLTFYTPIELKQSSQLRSVYSKQMYKKLKRFRKTNPTQSWWKVSLEEFREYLDIPNSYKVWHIDEKVIVPALEELSVYFKNLKYEKEYKKRKGRGRPSVSGYKFTFTPSVQHDIPKAHKKTGLICPKCGKPLIEKEINGNNCWCHADGWKEDAECKKIYNAVSEIQEELKTKEAPKIVNEEGQKKMSEIVQALADKF